MYRIDLSRNKNDAYPELRCSIARDLAIVETSSNVHSYMKKIPRSRLREWQQAAALGWPEAQYLLALHCVDKNTQYSSELLLKAAVQGFAPAQYGMGIRFYYGTGVLENAIEAERWLRKAAVQGHAKARDRLQDWNGNTLSEFMGEVDDFLVQRD